MLLDYRLIVTTVGRHRSKLGITLLLVFYLCPPVGLCAQATLKSASFIPQWIPQAQFAGYMTALDKGFYREAGIDLTLLEGGPAKPPLAALQSGQATFCSDWLCNAIEKRASGLRIVNLAQISRRSALILVAKKKSGIERPEDLSGKTVGLWSGQFYLQPRVLFQQYGLEVNIVPNYSSVSLFLKGGVDAMTAMWYNEYHTLLNSGLDPDDLTLFFFSDLGLNFPEDGIYCMEDTLIKDPELCAAFVNASIKGWLYAFDHPEETLNLIMAHAETAHTGTNKAHQRWMLSCMKDLIVPDGDRTAIGKLMPLDYTLVVEMLKDFRHIERLPDFHEFFRGPR